MNLIYLLLRSSKKMLAIAVFTGLVSGTCSIQLIALINTAVNNTTATANLAWSFVAIASLMVISRLASGLLLVRLSQKVIFDTRLLLSQQILSAPLRYLEELGTPRLMASLTDDVQSIATAVAYVPSFCVAIAAASGCFIYLAFLSWVTFLGFISFVIFGIFSYKLLTINSQKFLTLARNEQDKLFAHFRAITDGIKELKLHSQRRDIFLQEELQASAANSQHYNRIGLSVHAVALSWSQLLIFIFIGLVLFVISKITPLNQTILSGYVLTSIFIVTPLEVITNMLPHLSRASIALKKIEYISLGLASRSEKKLTDGKLPTGSWQQLELRGVTHTYRGERQDSSFILGPIDISFHPQELIFLVGGNGSGKSTLAKLIAGLYIPESGEIRVDGQLIDNHNREWYRQQFSAVFYDFYLFERLLGLENSNLDQQTQQYLMKLQLDHKVEVKDGVLSTTNLSQGQRKRLTLLTAYLEDRPFYLFDEWASDQDPIFKDIFYTQILPELKKRGKTILVISHDDRYFHLADRVLKLDYGKLDLHQSS
jgi:putative ATP-binding cassette transporter